MKRDIPTQAGIGFTILIAAATFVVAVVAGIFLIYQSEMNVSLNAQFPPPMQAQISPAQTLDLQQRGNQTSAPAPSR